LIFEYQNSGNGEIIEYDFPFGKTPPSKVERNGKIYHRIWRSLNIVYGPSFHNEGQIKFKRPPLEGEGFEFT
jgi:hypothetical protein